MMEIRQRGADHNRGIILIVVLWAVAMMSVIVAAAGTLAQKNLVAASVEDDRLRSSLALRSGLEIGKAFILSQAPETRVFLDGTAIETSLGSGLRLSVSVRDAAGYVDLNRANSKLIQSAAVASGLSGLQAETLAKLIGVLRKQAAEARDELVNGGRPMPEKPEENAETATPVDPIFVATGQIRKLVEMDEAAMNRFLTILGLHSATGLVNPFAAPESVLDAIPELSAEDRSAVMMAKRARQWEKDRRIASLLEKFKDYLAVEEPKSFVLEVRILGGEGVIAGSRARSVLLLSDGNVPMFRTLALSW